MSLNVGKVKGEMFIKNITEKDLRALQIPELSTLINNGSAPLSVITKLSDLLEVPSEFILDDNITNKFRLGTIVYDKLDVKRIKERSLELGWTNQNIATLFSDYENSFRYVTYGKLSRLYGYELRNLCFLLDCNLDYLFGGELKECEVDDLVVTHQMREFKLNPHKLRALLREKTSPDLDSKDISKKFKISLKYFDYLLKCDYSYISKNVLKCITSELKCTKEDLEYDTSDEVKEFKNKVVEKFKNKEEQENFKKESKKEDNATPKESKSNITTNYISYSETRRENKELKDNLDVTTKLIQLAVEDRNSFDLIIRLSKLNDNDKKCINDTLEVLLERFENK